MYLVRENNSDVQTRLQNVPGKTATDWEIKKM